MKNKFILILILSVFPMFGFAQEPEMIPAAEVSNNWPLSDLLPLILWPVGVFTILLIICFVILRPLRRRGSKKAKILTIVLPIIGWSIWHFYPSLSCQGYYEAQVEWLGETEVSYVEIGETYIIKGNEEVPDSEFPYYIEPFKRLMWVELDSPLLERIPVKLGWNKIYQPMIKIGFVKFKEIGEPEVGLYDENAQSSTATTPRTESHP